MSSPKAINPEMRYSRSIKLPPQSLAGVDEPVADRPKGQNQPNKNQVSHWKFPPILVKNSSLNHLSINLASKILPQESRMGQFFGKTGGGSDSDLFFLILILYNPKKKINSLR
jgi:hypothetical protein